MVDFKERVAVGSDLNCYVAFAFGGQAARLKEQLNPLEWPAPPSSSAGG